jgi:hypothetical protein
MRFQVLTAAIMKLRIFCDVLPVLNWMSIDVSEIRAASIIRAMTALMMEAASTSETSVYIQFRTRQYIPEDSELHRRFQIHPKYRKDQQKPENAAVLSPALLALRIIAAPLAQPPPPLFKYNFVVTN